LPIVINSVQQLIEAILPLVIDKAKATREAHPQVVPAYDLKKG